MQIAHARIRGWSKQTSLRQASRAPNANDAVSRAAKTGYRDFNRQRSYVLFPDQFLIILALRNTTGEWRATAVNWISRALNRNKVHQIENWSQIDRKIFGPLACKDPALRRTARDRNVVVNELVGIGWIVRHRFVAGIVERLHKSGAAATGELAACARALVASDLRDRVDFPFAEIGVGCAGDRANMA